MPAAAPGAVAGMARMSELFVRDALGETMREGNSGTSAWRVVLCGYGVARLRAARSHAGKLA